MKMGKEKPEKGIGLLIGIGGSPSHEGDESEVSDKELAFRAFRKAIAAKDDAAGLEAFGELLDSFDCEYVDDDSEETEDKSKDEEDEDY